MRSEFRHHMMPRGETDKPYHVPALPESRGAEWAEHVAEGTI